MKKYLLPLLVIAMLLQTASIAESNPRKGKKVFDNICRACHIDGTQAGELNPSSKTMQEWQQTIEKNKHRCDPKVLRELNKEDKEVLISFLKTFASDYDY